MKKYESKRNDNPMWSRKLIFGFIIAVIFLAGGIAGAKVYKKAEQKAQIKKEMAVLQKEVETLLADFDGEWSVYISEMNYEQEIVINNQEMYPASLIKLFVMETAYEHMEEITEYTAKYMRSTERAEKEIAYQMKAMIENSDNEAYNKLVKMQSEDKDFSEACSIINDDLKKYGYTHTEVHTTLHPAYSAFTSDNLGENTTCVEDVGKLLKKIYKGTCVDAESSEKMLNMLLNQNNTAKIPEGMPEGVRVANKTGETSEVQHDAAIVYGEKTDFILCVMTENYDDEEEVVDNIHKLSAVVYEGLNRNG